MKKISDDKDGVFQPLLKTLGRKYTALLLAGIVLVILIVLVLLVLRSTTVVSVGTDSTSVGTVSGDLNHSSNEKK